jgi:tripartite-type tricarboxylate transporter receptor subunit TctC
MSLRAKVLTRNQHKRRLITAHNARRRFLCVAASAATLPAMSRMTWAQIYPTRPITVIVPTAAGSSTDVIGRVVAERMKAVLGQPIIIENVSGADGTIGTGRAARARPDGYGDVDLTQLIEKTLRLRFSDFDGADSWG